MKNFIVMTLAILTLTACGKKSDKPEKEISCPVLTVTKSEKTIYLDYPASIKGCQAVDIRPQISGTLTKICIEEGSDVRNGQLLFIIDQVPYKAAYEIAKANVNSASAALATARLTLESNEALLLENVISDFDVQTSRNSVAEAEAKLALAQAELVNARNNLSYTEVRSPVDGRASMIPFRVGTLVSSSMAKPLVTVSDDSKAYVYISISENQLLDMIQDYGSTDKSLSQMTDVSLKLSNGVMYNHKGHIDAISGTIDEATGSIGVRAVFPNKEHLLHNGGSGSVVIPSVYKDCIAIPQAATYELQNKIFVYRVIDGKAVSTAIEVFPENDGASYIVKSGLSENDVIVAEGAGLIKNGTKIKSNNQKAPK